MFGYEKFAKKVGHLRPRIVHIGLLFIKTVPFYLKLYKPSML